MEVSTLFSEFLENLIESLCGSMANSASHMINSSVFTNSLTDTLTKIITSQLHGEAIVNKNALYSIKDSLRYMCATLDDVTSLAYTFREKK